MKEKWYKINSLGRIRPTVAGWICLIAWSYFVSRMFLSFKYQIDAGYPTSLGYYFSWVIGAITLLIGSWLIIAMLIYNHYLRKMFRCIATRLWKEQIIQELIPGPPVKKVRYNYQKWTSTIIYPNGKKYLAVFHFTFSISGLHSDIPPEVIEL